MKRVVTLDVLRGLAIFNIILIHTLWWSGTSYISNPLFRELSLLFEVPLFFYLSGFAAQLQTFDYKKFLFRFLKIYKNYLVFFLFFVLCLLFYETILNDFVITLKLTFLDIKDWILFRKHPNYELAVAGMGTFWFLHIFIPVYLMVPVLFFIKKTKAAFIFLLFGLVILISENNFSAFRLTYYFHNLGFCILYFFIFALGYFNLKIKSKKELFLCFLFLLTTIFLIRGKEIFTTNFQEFKFPPQLLYLLYSLFSIFIAAYFLNREKKSQKSRQVLLTKFFQYSGRNSLWIYFCQGISSSIVYQVLVLLKLFEINTLFTFLICFGFNIIFCYFLVFLLIRFNNVIDQAFSFLRRQFHCLLRHK